MSFLDQRNIEAGTGSATSLNGWPLGQQLWKTGRLNETAPTMSAIHSAIWAARSQDKAPNN